MARWVLVARKDEGPHRELAGLLVEAKDGDEIVVESSDLERAARRVLTVGGATGLITITTNPALVAEERGRLAGA